MFDYQKEKVKIARELIENKIDYLSREIANIAIHNKLDKDDVKRIDVLNEALQDTYNDYEDLSDINDDEDYKYARDIIRRYI